MNKRHADKKGFGLLELMLVMAIAITILVLVAAQNRQFQQQSNIRITQEHAEIIVDKMNIAYRVLCAEQEAEDFSNTATQEVLTNLLSDDDLSNPIDKSTLFNYRYVTFGSYFLINSTTEIPLVRSVVSLELPSQYGYYYGQLGAQCVVLEEPCIDSSDSDCNPCDLALEMGDLPTSSDTDDDDTSADLESDTDDDDTSADLESDADDDDTSSDPVFLVWTQLPSRIKLSTAPNALALYNTNLFNKQYVTYFQQNTGESNNQGEQILTKGFYLCQG